MSLASDRQPPRGRGRSRRFETAAEHEPHRFARRTRSPARRAAGV